MASKLRLTAPLVAIAAACAVAPGCNCSHPDLIECTGPTCVGPKSEHEVACDCGVDTPIGDAHFVLRLCLPPDLNDETGSPDQITAIDALTDQQYSDAVTAYCASRVAPALHDVVGFLNSAACGAATVTCTLTTTPSGRATTENAACDLPCAPITCDETICNPDVVAPDVEHIHPELCKCTQADGCPDITGESICIQPTWAPDPPSIQVGVLTRLVSLPSDVAIDHDASTGALTVTVDPDFPCGSDTESVTTHATGTLALYGRPCSGSQCDYLLDFEIFPDDFSMSFDTGFPCGGSTVNVTNAMIKGGTQGNFVTIAADGSGSIPAGALRLIADGIMNGDDRFKFDSPNTEPIPIQVDFAAGTFEMPSATVTFDDGEVTVHLVGSIIAQPPHANAGADQPAVECTSPSGAQVTLDATASTDPDGDISLYSWWAGSVFDSSALLGNGSTLQVVQALGTTDYALSVTDQRLATVSDHTQVTVVDTTPPTLDVQLSPSVLWPPNHKLVPITASVVITEACDPSATFVLTSITSDEPDNGTGDGDTANDIQGADIGTPDTEFLLRAERAGIGDGRTYTIVYTVTDGSGNTSDTVATVTVPHDQK